MSSLEGTIWDRSRETAGNAPRRGARHVPLVRWWSPGARSWALCARAHRLEHRVTRTPTCRTRACQATGCRRRLYAVATVSAYATRDCDSLGRPPQSASVWLPRGMAVTSFERVASREACDARHPLEPCRLARERSQRTLLRSAAGRSPLRASAPCAANSP